jgi:hypothetical protein
VSKQPAGSIHGKAAANKQYFAEGCHNEGVVLITAVAVIATVRKIPRFAGLGIFKA